MLASASFKEADLSGTNSITGTRTPEPAQGTFESIVIIQTPEPELQAPDPDEMFSPHPADGVDRPPSNALAGVIPETPVTNNNPPGGVDEPHDAGPAPEPERFNTGLGSKVDDIANLSPSLRGLLEKARSEGWQIKQRTDGRSEADHTSNPPTIYVNPNEIGPGGDWNAKFVALLAHEVGHAGTPYPELAEGRTKGEFVQKNTELSLLHEGAATFNNARVRDEIMDNGGPNTEIRGKWDAQYIAIYEAFKSGHITQDEAIRQMAQVQATEPDEVGADGKQMNRREKFEADYGGQWDDDHPKQ